jgi:hypothetical protein
MLSRAENPSDSTPIERLTGRKGTPVSIAS